MLLRPDANSILNNFFFLLSVNFLSLYHIACFVLPFYIFLVHSVHVFGPIQSDEAFCHFSYVLTSLCSAIFLLSYCAGYCSHLVILVQLRSLSSGLLFVPKFYTSFATRDFAVGAPHLLFGICFLLVLSQLQILLNSAVI